MAGDLKKKVLEKYVKKRGISQVAKDEFVRRTETMEVLKEEAIHQLEKAEAGRRNKNKGGDERSWWIVIWKNAESFAANDIS